MKCVICGYENEDNAIVCASCGSKLANNNQSSNNQSISEELINPNIVEKQEVNSESNDIFGAQEQYTVRSSDTYNDVLNMYTPNQPLEILAQDDNSSIENDEISIQELMDNVTLNEEKEEIAIPKINNDEDQPEGLVENPLDTVENTTAVVSNELVNTQNPVQNTPNNIVNNENINANEINANLTNPVSTEVEEQLNDKVNLFILIKLMFGAILKPGTTIQFNTRAYIKIAPSMKIYSFFSFITFIAFLATNLFNSCFIKVYDININSYTTTFSIAALKNVDYVNTVIIGILLTFGVTLLTTLVYYIASFITNKGLSFGRYLAVITLCLLPFYLGTCIIGPLASIPSYYIGVAVNFLGIIYSFIILITTLNDMLSFKTTNQKIIYHTLILSIIFTIIGIVISIFLKDLLTALKLVM